MRTDYPPKRTTGGNTHTTKRKISKKKRRMRRIRMIRRTVLVLFVCLVIGLAVYLGQRDKPSDPNIPPKETGQATEPIHSDDHNPVYGKTASYDSVSDTLQVHIQYPQGELQGLEDAIRNWIQQTVLHYATELEGESLEKPAQLNVDYACFLVESGYIDVRFQGEFLHPNREHPEAVVKTFNVNGVTGEVVKLETYLDGMKSSWIQVMAAQKVGLPEADAGIVENWFIADDGIALLLAGEAYLCQPGEIATIRFTNAELAEIKKNPPRDFSHIDPNKPMVALTFDDGPCKHTERLLDLFAQYGGKGTFYVVGNMIDERPDLVKRMVAEGHEVGGHSWSHKDLSELSRDSIKEQLVKTKEKIHEVTGYWSITMRPPWGNVNDTVKSVAKESGLSMILWSVDTQDWLLQDADKVYASVMQQVKDGAIILMHDLHGTTVTAMERVIPELLAKGYQLVTVPELLLCQNGSMEPGKLYSSR